MSLNLSEDLWGNMYDPQEAVPLSFYKPIHPTIMAAWYTAELDIATIDELLPWTLGEHLPTPESRTPSNFLRYYVELENWMKKVKQFYERDQNFFYSQVPYLVEAARMMVGMAASILFERPQLFYKEELGQRMWTYGVQEVARILRKSYPRPTPRDMFNKTCVLPLFLTKVVESYEFFCNEAILTGMEPERSIVHNYKSRQVFFFAKKFTSAENQLIDLLYRLRICMGDMERYMPPKGSRYFESYINYEIARFLRPDYGRAYYQLGVLAMMQNQVISAMFYFARAYFSKKPTEGAKDQVLEIHAKSHNERKTKRREYWYSVSKYKENRIHNSRANNKRRKIWIMCYPFPVKLDEPRPAEIPTPSKKEHIASLSTDELNHRFSITFTDVMGKLFTRVGMDEFEEVAEESLVYFEAILTMKEQPANGLNLIKMMQVVGLTTSIINQMKEKLKLDPPNDKLARKQLLHYLRTASYYVLELFSLAAERLSKMLDIMEWDHPQTYYLSSAVWVWLYWMIENISLWSREHVRPIFSIRRIEKSRNLNKSDQTDDIWEVFSQLLTRVERLVTQQEFRPLCNFPMILARDPSDEHDQPHVHLPTREEILILQGLPPFVDASMYDKQYWMMGRDNKQRAYLMTNLVFIHTLGTKYIYRKLGLVKLKVARLYGNPKIKVYTSNTKLIMPKELVDSCGLYERNFVFHIINLERLNAPEKPVQERPPGYSSRTIDRKKKVVRSFRPVEHDLPTTDTAKIWCFMNDLGFRSDMVVITRRLIIDTNCFINKLKYVEKLMRIFTYPLLLPVTVVLELKGLAKGGLRVRHREKYKGETTTEALERIKEGNATGFDAKEALELIEKNISCFKLVTMRGRIFKVKSILSKIQDESFDPTVRNDNRILESCIYLEHNDKETRKLDTPLRLYRKTVLITDDRGLHVKGSVYQIPVKEIEPFVKWVEKYKKPTGIRTLPPHVKPVELPVRPSPKLTPPHLVKSVPTPKKSKH